MHACIIVECCQRDMLRPLVGHVEQVHELHCRLHCHVYPALFQHQQSDVLLQALQCSLQGKKQEPQMSEQGCILPCSAEPSRTKALLSFSQLRDKRHDGVS